MRAVHLSSDRLQHAAPITHIAFRADGRRLASSSYDGTVLVWDVEDRRRPTPVARLHHRRLVNASAWNPRDPEVLATASADKTVAVWRIGADGAVAAISTLARHTDDINSVGWLPDGERLICVSEDGRATMWDGLTGRFLASVASHAAHCMMVSVNNKGLVATVGEDGMVAVFSPDDDTRRATKLYESSVEGCEWSPDGDTLAIARDDGRVDLLTAALDVVVSAEVSGSAVRSVAWIDEEVFVAGAYDGALHFIDRSGAVIGRHSDDRAWPRSVGAARGVVAVGSFWSTPHLLDARTRELVHPPAEPTHGPNAIAVHGQDVFVGCDSGLVVRLPVAVIRRGVDVDPGSVDVLSTGGGPVLSLAHRDTGLFAGTYSGEVLHLADGDWRRTGVGAPVPSLVAHGTGVLAGTYNGELVHVGGPRLAELSRVRGHDGSVKSLAAFADGDIVSGATDRTVAIGDHRRRTPLWEHGNLVNSVATLGHWVASASRDHTVKVGRVARDPRGDWAASDIRTFLGPDESVKAVALIGDPAAPVVLGGSYDFKVYAWHVAATGAAEDRLAGRVVFDFDQAVSCMVRVDERRALVAGWDGRLVLVEAAPDGRVAVVGELSLPDLVAAAAPGAVVRS
ncbi:WD40 repeat domain-containing protein [Saccharothrix sp. S26]|uniref:WD40 repeat domain-containing protein n=1 Tax=Saccharothrix sp. S26 TaxID=2907215 RepID=UPI001F3C611D|nr:WD40 repeat domain-containing protein [Saccharothrix sp. S26]MCE6995206.1 WD40 repeat domain-containing protein [Saccharothrix sp. S26]